MSLLQPRSRRCEVDLVKRLPLSRRRDASSRTDEDARPKRLVRPDLFVCTILAFRFATPGEGRCGRPCGRAELGMKASLHDRNWAEHRWVNRAWAPWVVGLVLSIVVILARYVGA
jgi:hypothetical protein